LVPEARVEMPPLVQMVQILYLAPLHLLVAAEEAAVATD
jgi:hypothetical protein